MSELLENRPILFLVMGCNGVGKTTWKRAYPEKIPEHCYDLDSWADGIGDWNDDAVRDRVRQMFEKAVSKHTERGESFGTETTYSGHRGTDILDRALANGYVAEGIYLGTESHEVNTSRIMTRTECLHGHWVNPARVAERWKWSLSNLRKTAERFLDLKVYDNSREVERGAPRPSLQCVLTNGNVSWLAKQENHAEWFKAWLHRYNARLEQVKAQRDRLERKSAARERILLGDTVRLADQADGMTPSPRTDGTGDCS